MKMYYDDLACRTVADRAAMIQRYVGDQVGDVGGIGSGPVD